jgi:hypothetical protein
VTAPVELRIAELILDGVEPGDRDAIADALTRHLPPAAPAELDPRALAAELGPAIEDAAGRRW